MSNSARSSGKPDKNTVNLQTLFDTLDDIFLVVDRNGRILHCNAAARSRLGYAEKDILNMSAVRLHPPEYAGEAAQCLAELIDGRKQICTIPMFTSGGEEIPVETKATRGLWGRKKVLFYVSRDTSIRNQAERLMHIQKDLAVSLSQTFDLNEALNLFLTSSIKCHNFDCGGIYLVDKADSSLVLHAHQGLSEKFLSKVSRSEADTPQTRLVMRGEAVYFGRQKLPPPLEKARQEEGIKAIAVIPVLFRRKVVACLNIASRTLNEIPDFVRNALESIASPIGNVLSRIHSRKDLQDLSDELESQFQERTAELASVNAQLLKTKWQQKALLDSIPDIAWLKDMESRFIAVNKPFAQTCGLKPEELVGKTDLDIWPGNLAARYRADDREVLRSGKMKRVEEPLVDIRGRKSWIETIKVPILSPEEQVIGTAGVARDITERKLSEALLRRNREELETLVRLRTTELEKTNEHLRVEIADRVRAEEALRTSLAEKEILLKEIHHRVKNNLQLISSLLNLQSRHSPDRKSAEAFMEILNRIKSIALIHEKLYRVKDYSNIDFSAYLKSLLDNLKRSYAVNPEKVGFVIEIEDISLNLDLALPCGLVINELVSNCLKHAFPQNEKGEVFIRFFSSGKNLFTFTVGNKGSGIVFPEDLDFRETKTLGLQLVCTLVSQLRGEISLNRMDGTEFRVTFPGKNEEKGDLP